MAFMIQLYCTGVNLPFVDPPAAQPHLPNQEALQWHLCVKEVLGHNVVFALDVKTLYWLCFEWCQEWDREAFLKYFVQRIIEDALRVCDLTPTESRELGYWVAIALEPVELYAVTDRLLHRDLKIQTSFIADLLSDNYPIPQTNAAWFDLCLPFNRSSRTQEPSPVAAFQNFWLGLLQFMQHHKSPGNSDNTTRSNVVPFRPRSK